MTDDYLYQLLSAQKGHQNFRVGAEIERYVLVGNRPASYSRDVEPLFAELVREKSWEVYYEESGHLLGLKKGDDYISLEPGAQVEVSGAPQPSIFDIQKNVASIENEILSSKAAKGWRWGDLGLNPSQALSDIELIPSPRYKFMTEYYPLHAERGLEMMRLTAGFHLNLDFFEEKAACEMLKAGFYLAPRFAALGANSPFIGAKKAPNLSERSAIWLKNDSKRSGFLNFVFEPHFSFKDYVNFVWQIPMMYYFGEDGRAVRGDGRSLRDLPQELQKRNAVPALRQVFTEARFKPCCVELRSFDQQEPALRYAMMAFCVGLIYEPESLAQLQKSYGSTKAEDLRKLMAQVAAEGMSSDALFQELQSLYKLAEAGLIRRKQGEEALLAPLEKLFSARKTPAEFALDDPQYGEFL